MREPIARWSGGASVLRASPRGPAVGSTRRRCSPPSLNTLLVSVMHVNNETGVVQPIVEIADGLDGSRALFHVDAAQSFGKLIEPLRHPRIDLIAACAHKIMGPQGVGALIVRRRARLLRYVR